MSNIEKKPSLRISPNVYGLIEAKNRVRYFIDPNGEGTETGVPEKVVLTRWRKRQFPNFSFCAAHLTTENVRQQLHGFIAKITFKKDAPKTRSKASISAMKSKST
jgi:hypothetical protein